MCAFAYARDEDLPNATSQELPHGVPATVPVVEIADDTHALGVGSPNVKGRPAHAPHFFQVSAQLFIKLPVVALCTKVQVEWTKDRSEGIRINLRPPLP